MHDILTGIYIVIWLLFGWGFTTWMIRRNFGRRTPFKTLSVEVSMMIVWWVLFSIVGLFWPILPIWWLFKKIKNKFQINNNLNITK